MAMATVKKVKNAKIGSKVRCVNYSNYDNYHTIVDVTTNELGTKLFWLSCGGCFSRNEIEVLKS